MNTSTRLGELLVRRKLVTQVQLDAAIAEQRQSKLPIGQILVQHKVLSARQLNRSLRRQNAVRNALMVTALSVAPLHFVHAEDAAADLDTGATANASVKKPYPIGEALLSPDLWQSPGEYMAPSTGNYRPDTILFSFDNSEPAMFSGSYNVGKSVISPKWNPLKNEFRGGVKGKQKGFRYKVKYSKDSFKIQARYQF